MKTKEAKSIKKRRNTPSARLCRRIANKLEESAVAAKGLGRTQKLPRISRTNTGSGQPGLQLYVVDSDFSCEEITGTIAEMSAPDSSDNP